MPTVTAAWMRWLMRPQMSELLKDPAVVEATVVLLTQHNV
jgi:hypothetical protein